MPNRVTACLDFSAADRIFRSLADVTPVGRITVKARRMAHHVPEAGRVRVASAGRMRAGTAGVEPQAGDGHEHVAVAGVNGDPFAVALFAVVEIRLEGIEPFSRPASRRT